MRIREIIFKDFRSFRGTHRISFVDPLTDTVRPVSVLGGSNGMGKTTILDAIEALLGLVSDSPSIPRPLVGEAQKTGLICMALELSSTELLEANGQQTTQNDQPTQILHIAIGRPDLLPQSPPDEVWPNFLGYFAGYSQSTENGIILGDRATTISGMSNGIILRNRASAAVSSMLRGKADFHGGLLYFPHDRQLNIKKGGPILPPPEERLWNFRFSSSDRWEGSLEQFWVWQNYLDLEQNTRKHDNLKPFVASVENILGQDRQITIKEGRATVPAFWPNAGEAPRVRLDQLPSGEQQVLLLFGELARRQRKGVVIAIDEIENSLHPTLQRQVMWNLRRLAREWEAQVIVATHSLEVINTVRGGAFINLDYPEDRFNLPLLDDDNEETAT